jgi:dsDNA-binding SOS-regulon protein
MSDIKVSVTINVNGEETEVSVPLKKLNSLENASIVTEYSKDAKDLELRLMTTDDNDDDKQMSLNVDVLAYIKKNLRENNRAEVLRFLNKNKDRFTRELKEMLKDSIQAFIKGKTKDES